jgi:hypothetical protein
MARSLPGTLEPKYPGAAGGAQWATGNVADMHYPALLGLSPGLYAAKAAVAQIPDAIGHPFEVAVPGVTSFIDNYPGFTATLRSPGQYLDHHRYTE